MGRHREAFLALFECLLLEEEESSRRAVRQEAARAARDLLEGERQERMRRQQQQVRIGSLISKSIYTLSKDLRQSQKGYLLLCICLSSVSQPRNSH